MRRLALGAIVLAAAACGAEVGADGVWVPIGDLAPPLVAESGDLPPTGRAAPSAPSTLRVVTFNVERGEDPDAIAEAILGNAELADAGVYLLQEEETHPTETRSRASRLADALGVAFTYVPARTYGDGTHGLAILSRYPMAEITAMTLPRTTGTGRIAIAAQIQIGTFTLPVIDVHLDTTINITDRILQLRPAVIDAPDTVLVAGDFNTNRFMWQDGVPLLPQATAADTDQAPILDDYMRAIGFDTPTSRLGATEHMYGVESRLDSIYVRGLTATPGAVERDVDVSDHWPMWIDLALPVPPRE